MCLAIPGRLAAITEGEGFDRRGTVDYDGARQEVSLAYLPDVQVGDYVLVHVGFAMTQVDTEEAERLLQELRDLGGEVGDGFDRFHAVGHARGVAEIDDVLVGQALHQRADDRQPADAGIEYADGGVCIRGHEWQDGGMRKTAFYPQDFKARSKP